MDTRIYESSRLLPQHHLAQNNPTQKSLTIHQILIEQKKLIGLLENGQINQPNFKKDLDTLRTHIVDATVYSPRTEDKETMLKLSAALERVYSIPDLPDSEFKGLAKKTLLEMIKDSNDPKQPETTSTPRPSQPETTPTSRPSTDLFPVHENQIADGSPVSIEKLKLTLPLHNVSHNFTA
jgi:CRISPR/Cas system CMR subunit Cmr6 (Cas7 group RAMP superfamily)